MTPPDPRQLAKTATRKATGLLGRSHGESVGAQQTVTIGSTQDRLEALLRNAAVLDRLAGDFAEVSEPQSDTFLWTVGSSGNTSEITTTLTVGTDALLWAAADEDEPAESLRVSFAEAPRGLGTEVQLQLYLSPQPGIPTDLTQLAVGGALLKVLHRFKALVETDEIPALTANPAARNGGADHKENH